MSNQVEGQSVSPNDAKPVLAVPLPLLNALGDLLSGDSGCPMCDSGKLRNPEKEHWDDCKWHNALKVYESYKRQ